MPNTVTMSDHGLNNATGSSTEGGIPQADADFLIACLQSPAGGGTFAVDYAKVAELKGFKNPKSVQNKVSLLKKKYNLPIGGVSVAKGDTPKKASAAAGPTEPAVPKTPNKDKVTKAKATPKKKTTPKSAAKKGNKGDVKDDIMEDAEENEDHAVKSPTSNDEAVFGKKESSEEDEED